MADEKGKPIAAELLGVHAGLKPRPPANPEAPQPCAACGLPHGSIGVHIACLSATVITLRGHDDKRHLARLRDDATEWLDRVRATLGKTSPDDALRVAGKRDVLEWLLEQLAGK